MTYCLQLTSVYRAVCKSSTKMRYKQTHPQLIKSKYRLYSPSSITAAYRSVKEDGMSVLRAARTYRVPETTLRDRVLAKVDAETCVMGWSNLEVLQRYLTEYFIKFVPARNDHPLILFLDAHKSHVSLTLADWAKKNNIIMFIVPAHTSHLCQPLDVSCYGPFQRMYHCQCHKFTRQTSATITRYNICELSCKVYTKALSADNLQSGFMRTGIYPVDRNAIPKSSLIPAEVFESESEVEVCSQTTESTVEGGVLVDDEDRLDVFEVIEKELRSVKKEKSVKKSRNTNLEIKG